MFFFFLLLRKKLTVQSKIVNTSRNNNNPPYQIKAGLWPMSTMAHIPRLLLVYHSRTGFAEQMARACASGAAGVAAEMDSQVCYTMKLGFWCSNSWTPRPDDADFRTNAESPRCNKHRPFVRWWLLICSSREFSLCERRDAGVLPFVLLLGLLGWIKHVPYHENLILIIDYMCYWRMTARSARWSLADP